MPECACLYGDDGDMPEFFDERWVVARSEYRCFECRRGIWPRDKHVRITGKWDGEVRTYRFCADCHDIARSLYCDSFTFGVLWEDIEEQLFSSGAVNSACLDKLATVGGKQYLAERWWAWVKEHAQ